MKINEDKIRDLMMNYEFVKPRIIERFASKVTKEKPKQDRVLKPIKYTDLMMEYVIDVNDCLDQSDEDENCVYMVITNSMLDFWNVSIRDISEIAKFNTPRLLPAKIQTIGNMLGLSDLPSPMVVVTNNKLNRGAGAILYKSTEDEVREILENDFYILPSSIHETLCVSKLNFYPKDLYDMVAEINNSTMIDMKDILDYNIFEFKQGKFKALF